MEVGTLATLLIVVLGVTSTNARYCGHKLDVALVLAGSDSITTTDFRKLKSAAIQMAQDLDLGRDSQRLGAIVFNTDIYPRSSYRSFRSLISRISQPRGGTATHLAIKSMQDMFKRYGRSGVKKIGIVITDGKYSSVSLTEIAASNAIKSRHCDVCKWSWC